MGCRVYEGVGIVVVFVVLLLFWSVLGWCGYGCGMSVELLLELEEKVVLEFEVGVMLEKCVGV